MTNTASFRTFIGQMAVISLILAILGYGGYRRWQQRPPPPQINAPGMYPGHAIPQWSVMFKLIHEAHLCAASERQIEVPRMADALPYTVLWPLTRAGAPWPFDQADPEGPFPRIAWRPQEGEKYEWRMEDTRYDFTHPSTGGTGALIGIVPRNYPPPQYEAAIESRMARGLLQPPVIYIETHRRPPKTPGDAYLALNMGLVRPALLRVQSHFRTIEFYSDPQGHTVALLLVNEAGRRTLLFNEPNNPQETGSRGYLDPDQSVEIDTLLSQLKPWGDLASLNVPIIDLPPLPEGAGDE